MERGFALTDKQLRERLINGLHFEPKGSAIRSNLSNFDLKDIKGGQTFVDDTTRGQVQVTSLEPPIEQDVFETDCGFRCKPGEEVYTALKQAHGGSIKPLEWNKEHDGYLLRKGRTYVMPTSVKISSGLYDGNMVDPKSSLGREFFRTRTLLDCFDSYDQFFFSKYNDELCGKDLRFWLHLRPTKGDYIIGPGLTFNQIRQTWGYDWALSDSEIRDLHKQLGEEEVSYDANESPIPGGLVYLFNGAGNAPTRIEDPEIYQGLRLHVDLDGSHVKDRIIAYIAREHKEPIDLRNKQEHSWKKFWDIRTDNDLVNGNLWVESGQRVLLTSKELLYTPNSVCSELVTHSNVGADGPWDDAGFIDTGFCFSHLTYEYTCREPEGTYLSDNMRASSLMFNRLGSEPLRVYGSDGANNYLGQKGVRLGKYYK